MFALNFTRPADDANISPDFPSFKEIKEFYLWQESLPDGDKTKELSKVFLAAMEGYAEKMPSTFKRSSKDGREEADRVTRDYQDKLKQIVDSLRATRK